MGCSRSHSTLHSATWRWLWLGIGVAGALDPTTPIAASTPAQALPLVTSRPMQSPLKWPNGGGSIGGRGSMDGHHGGAYLCDGAPLTSAARSDTNGTFNDLAALPLACSPRRSYRAVAFTFAWPTNC